jgi:hypothetical protein
MVPFYRKSQAPSFNFPGLASSSKTATTSNNPSTSRTGPPYPPPPVLRKSANSQTSQFLWSRDKRIPLDRGKAAGSPGQQSDLSPFASYTPFVLCTPRDPKCQLRSHWKMHLAFHGSAPPLDLESFAGKVSLCMAWSGEGGWEKGWYRTSTAPGRKSGQSCTSPSNSRRPVI